MNATSTPYVTDGPETPARVGSTELLGLTVEDSKIIVELLGDMLHSSIWLRLDSREPKQYQYFCREPWPKLVAKSQCE